MAYRPGISALIIATLIASAMVRLGINSDVLAKELTPATSEILDPSTTSDACPAPQAPLSLLQAIQEQKQSLETREDRFANRMKALELAEASLKQQEENLIVAEERLAATLALADDAAENDLKKLTNVYETMKPKAAAALFSEMAPEFAAGFLGRMRSDAAGAVLAALAPEKAYKISIILAGRNAAAPRN